MEVTDTAFPSAPEALEADVPEQIRVRQGKREAMLAAGVQPYPESVPVTHTIAQVRGAWEDLQAGANLVRADAPVNPIAGAPTLTLDLSVDQGFLEVRA